MSALKVPNFILKFVSKKLIFEFVFYFYFSIRSFSGGYTWILNIVGMTLRTFWGYGNII